MTEHAINKFDGIVYINLATRPDRKARIERELAKFTISLKKIHRVEAHLDELNGTRGCALSHCDALELALDHGWKNALILEDDCYFIKNQEQINLYVETFFDHFQDDWDVFFLGTDLILSHQTSHPKYLRVIFSMRAHSYVVAEPYMKKLRDQFFNTYQSMKKDIFYLTSLKKAIDRSWVELQASDRWYVGKEMITEQSASYSDIEKKEKPNR